MKLLPATEPLEFVAIYIPGELILTKRVNRSILVITDLSTKLNLTVPLENSTTTALT